MSVKVSAVIVTWNSAKDIAACVDSLVGQTYRLDGIVVVDNASIDGTADFVAESYPQVKLIRMEENVGFAKGNNVGIEAVGGDWVVLLNPDAKLEPDWVEKLLTFAENRERVGALGGVLWRSGDRIKERTIVDSVGIEIFESRRVRDAGFSGGASVIPDQPVRVFGVCAAAVMLKKAMIEDVKIDGQLFPERFFCYYEDADLAWRGWRRGWEAWTVPTAEGFHYRGGSPVGNRFSRYMTHRNHLWMVLRNEKPSKLAGSLSAIAGHAALMVARTIVYPYLVGAVWQSIAGIGLSIEERDKLPDVSVDPLPFRSGTGFGK